MRKNLKVLFYGGGAVGAFYGWTIKKYIPNSIVHVACRSNYEAVKEKGYDIKSYIANEKFVPDRVFKSREAIIEDLNSSGLEYDYVFLSTKVSFDKAKSVDLLKGILNSKKTALVLLQNGIGIEQLFAEEFVDTPIITCVLMILCKLINKTEVVHVSFTKIIMGPFYLKKQQWEQSLQDCTKPGNAIFALRDLLDIFSNTRTNIKIIEDPYDIQSVRWSKVAVNIVAGGTQVLSGGCTAGDLWSEDLVQHTTATLNEIFDAGKQIFKLPFPRPDCPSVESLRKANLQAPEANMSFTRDWLAGNELELETLFGNTLCVASKYNVDLPRTHCMYSLIKAYKYNIPIKPKSSYDYGSCSKNVVIVPE